MFHLKMVSESKPKVDVACKQKIRICHKKCITVAITKTFLNSDYKM